MSSQKGEGDITALHELATEQSSSKAGRNIVERTVRKGRARKECEYATPPPHTHACTHRSKTDTNLRRHPHATHGDIHRATFLQHF